MKSLLTPNVTDNRAKQCPSGDHCMCSRGPHCCQQLVARLLAEVAGVVGPSLALPVDLHSCSFI